MSDLKRLIGNRVRILRKEKGLSQEQLGFKAQLHHTYVGAVERGEKNISIDSLERLSEGLGVGLGEILNHLTGPESEDTMRAFIAQEIKNASPSTLTIVFALLAGRKDADKMRASVAREIKHSSPASVKMVFDLMKDIKELESQPVSKKRTGR